MALDIKKLQKLQKTIDKKAQAAEDAYWEIEQSGATDKVIDAFDNYYKKLQDISNELDGIIADVKGGDEDDVAEAVKDAAKLFKTIKALKEPKSK